MDSGRNFFKVCLTIHSKDENPKLQADKKGFGQKYLNSGVKKVIILAAVENCCELYENVKEVFEALKLDEMDFVACADYKMQNTSMGMSAPSCTYPCVLCEGRYFSKTGTWDDNRTPRTFGSCRQNALKFENAEEKAKIPANFKNNIHQPLIGINEPDDRETIDVIAIAGLHLDLGIGNKLLFKANTLSGKDIVSPYIIHIYDLVGHMIINTISIFRSSSGLSL